ncbi:MAG: aspartate/glutamate racemase family protein [Bacillota bacterium]
MNKFKIGIIRVISTDDEYIKYRHQEIIEKFLPMFKIKTVCITNQPEGIHNVKTKKKAVPKIIKLGIKMSKEVDGIIISCAEDPGVKELIKKINKPVVGPGRAAAVSALDFGNRVVAISLSDQVPSIYEEVLGKKLIKVINVSNINKSMDLTNKDSIEKIVKAVKDYKEEYDVITLTCTGMSTIDLPEILSKELEIPVIDPVRSAGLLMYEYLIQYSNIRSQKGGLE